MKKNWMPWIMAALMLACSRPAEAPLVLPAAAEPSAKMHNDQGIRQFEAGRYKEALIKFTQAAVADSTSGEIQFNLGLAYHERGEDEKAREHFLRARTHAKGNTAITQSPLLNQLLDAGPP